MFRGRALVIILLLNVQTVQIREFHTSTVFTVFLRMQTIDGFLSIFKEATESMFYYCEHFLNYLVYNYSYLGSKR